MEDRYDLERFVTAQDSGGMYRQAVAELRAGAKRSFFDDGPAADLGTDYRCRRVDQYFHVGAPRKVPDAGPDKLCSVLARRFTGTELRSGSLGIGQPVEPEAAPAVSGRLPSPPATSARSCRTHRYDAFHDLKQQC